MKLMESLKRSLPHSSPAGRADAPMAFPAGHFYSPVPSIASVLRRESAVFEVPDTIAGVDLNVEGQMETVGAVAPFCADQPFTELSAARFKVPNDNFSIGEAVLYYGFLRWLRPSRVVEVGSGYTTAVLLDTLDREDQPATAVTCVEPHPELMQSLLRPGDAARLRIVASELQDVDFAVFDALEANDLLFVDSTHVMKTEAT